MPSNAAFIYSPEAQTGTALSSILEAEAPPVAINLPRIAETASTTSTERHEYALVSPDWSLIGVIFFSLLLWWGIFTYAFPALVSALNFLFNLSAA
jgi:hypothetical protein